MRGGAHDNAQIPFLYCNFRCLLLGQRLVSAYHCSRCWNSHVQENMLSANRFTVLQGKTASSWLSEFWVSLQNFQVSFWHPKTAYKTLTKIKKDVKASCCEWKRLLLPFSLILLFFQLLSTLWG